MDTPLVTVVIPCFNAAASLAGTIESVLAQSEERFELLVIDDGSTDDSANVVAGFASVDPRIWMYRQPNAGVSAARNVGATLARAPIVAFLDADDRWHPDTLRAHLEAFGGSPNLGISFARCRIVNDNGRWSGQVTRPKLQGLTTADLLATNPTATCSNLVVRKAVFEQVGGFRTGMQHAEDQEWLFRAVAGGAAIRGIDSLLVDYRCSAGGLSSQLDAMLCGWEAMVTAAREHDPRTVAACYSHARARYLRYLARRALRLRQPPTTALRFLFAALSEDWRLLLAEPRATVLTLGGCVLGLCSPRRLVPFPRNLGA
jgi:glycosyltransferase involved in cell wall biosynthesis